MEYRVSLWIFSLRFEDLKVFYQVIMLLNAFHEKKKVSEPWIAKKKKVHTAFLRKAQYNWSIRQIKSDHRNLLKK